MSTLSPLSDAIRVATVASAHLSAYDRVGAAMVACQRLGALSSGRWRSAARDLERLVDELQSASEQVALDVATRATQLGVEEGALWTAGDAAGTLDLLESQAVEELDEGSFGARLLSDSEILFGIAFLEDEESPDRGSTLLFGWPDPLQPAVWPWQANWLADEGDEGEGEELDLSPTGDLEIGEEFLAATCTALQLQPESAARALSEVAEAFTRVSLLINNGADEEEDDEDEESSEADGTV